MEVESTRAIPDVILEALRFGLGFGFAGAIFTLAFAPRRVVLFLCFHLVLVVLHECIVPSMASKVKPNQGLFRNFLGLDLAPTLPLETVPHPHQYDDDGGCHADGE